MVLGGLKRMTNYNKQNGTTTLHLKYMWFILAYKTTTTTINKPLARDSKQLKFTRSSLVFLHLFRFLMHIYHYYFVCTSPHFRLGAEGVGAAHCTVSDTRDVQAMEEDSTLQPAG